MGIGGNRDYGSIMAALRICLKHMPGLRLIVVKSSELRQLLLRFDTDASSIARNLQVATTEDDIAAALVQEVQCRGGELPLDFVYRFSPRLRYHIGKKRLLPFLNFRPEFEVFEFPDGSPELRARVRVVAAATGSRSTADLGATASERAVAIAGLTEKVRRQFGEGVEHRELGELFARLRWRGIQSYLASVPDADSYAAALDHSLDPRKPAPWSEAWQNAVAMRHLHRFLLSSGEFSIASAVGDAGATLPLDELRNLRVTHNSDAGRALVPQSDEVEKNREGGVLFQVVDAVWSHDGTDELAAEFLTGLQVVVPI